ncbi:hypothetical protein M3908_003293 [Vibrio metschnikovii]|nr:hypothetical protein [Vibrio metschnikovii]
MSYLTQSFLVTSCKSFAQFRNEVRKLAEKYIWHGGLYYFNDQMIILLQRENNLINRGIVELHNLMLQYDSEYIFSTYDVDVKFTDFKVSTISKFIEYIDSDNYWMEKESKISKLLSSLFNQVIKEAQYSNNMSRNIKERYLTKVPDRYKPENIHKIVKGFSLSKTASFSNMMWYRKRFRLELKSKFNIKTEFTLEDKILGANFARELGLKVPVVYHDGVELSKLQLGEKKVVKPSSAAGANGVFLIYEENNIFDVKNKKKIFSIDELRINLESYLERSGKDDSWIVEELICSPDGKFPNDYKFYCFYGEIPIMLEVSRYPEDRYHWHRIDKNSPEFWKYSDRLFEGTFLNEDYLGEIKRVSLSIPAPFIRIDFYPSKDGLIFGEFTPAPGSFHDFPDDADRFLGQCLIEAEVRLFNDLRNGKKFDEFDSLTKNSSSKK